MSDVVNVGILPDDGKGAVDRDAFIAINQALAPLLLHILDKGNPHAATAKQVGAYSKLEADQNLKAALQGLPTLTNVAASISTAIAALALGTAAGRDVGTSAGNVPVLDSTARLLASMLPASVVLSVAGLAQTTITEPQLRAALLAFVGDTGLGGTKGLVPAPVAGDGAAGKFLRADGIFAVPASSSGGTTTAQASAIARRAALILG